MSDEQQPAGFEFTDAELAAAEERLERKRWEDGERRTSQPTPAGETLAAMLERLHGIAEVAEREKQSLPCFQATSAGDLGAAAAACRAVGGHLGDREQKGGPLGCRWRQHGEWCALEREGETLRRATELLQLAGVPVRLRNRVLSAIPGVEKLVQLEPTQALRAARAFAAAPRPAGCQLDAGGHLAFMGSEWVLTLAGPPGTGKSVAAAYIVARCGGSWLSARNLANPKFELGLFERAPLLVIDDLGTEYAGATAYGTERAGALLELRHEQDRRTVVTTNLNLEDIGARYGARLASRLKEQGRFVAAKGADLRGAAA